MAVKFIKKRDKELTRYSPDPSADRSHVEQLVLDVAKVDAVAGLRQAIEQQQMRCEKLRMFESTLPYTLKELSNEIKLLKEMYNDVIKFQTDRSVLEFMKQQTSNPGVLDSLTEFTVEITNRNQLAGATQKAIELLESIDLDVIDL